MSRIITRLAPASVGNKTVRFCKRSSRSLIIRDYATFQSDILHREKLTTSYVCGRNGTPLVSLTIGQLLQRSADRFGDNQAAVFCAQKIHKTFHQLLQDVDQAAAGLLSLGLKRGDRVGIWGPNSYEWFVAQWAIARAGLIVVTINPAYKINELRYALNKVDVKALVIAEKMRSEILPEMLSQLLVPQPQGHGIEVVRSQMVPSLERVVVLSDQTNIGGALLWKDILDRATPSLVNEVHNMQKRIQFDDPVNIQYTSGTTGNPKGCTLSHHNLVNYGCLSSVRLGYAEKMSKLCLPIPLYHLFATMGSLGAIANGSASVFPGPIYNSRDTLQAIQEEKCTALYGVPTMLLDILHAPNFKEFDVSSLNMVVTGATPVPIELAQALTKAMGLDHIMIGYGMTETSATAFMTLRSDGLETNCSTVGCVTDHTEIKIIDPATDEILPINTPGEILIRGFGVMLEYWNDKEKTNETITKSRWLRSGDVGVLDEDGYCRIVGRIKDMIIRGGENIFPAEIEQVLHTHPAVQEAHVVGVPDKRTGEEVCAWIRCKIGAKVTEGELKSFCKERLAYFKIPQYWLFTDTFPVAATGKVPKNILRDMSVKQLGL